jgi:hypothetical protein
VPEVISELAAAPDRFVIFVDDNLTADRAYAAQLFRALAPLRKRWVAQSTLAIADDPAFLDLAARAGCVGLFVGLETFSQESLDEAAKTTHRAAACRAAVAALHARGIAVEAGVVFGFDSDTPAVFERTLRELDRAGIDLVQISILTPLPGTPQFDAMRARLTDGDWSHYDFHHVVFRPLRMTPEALQAGHDWATREFYRPWHILRRLARHACRPRGFGTLPYLAALSFAYCGRIASWGIRGWNPAAAKAANTQPCAEGAGCAICDGRMRLPRAMVNREVAHASLCTSTPAGFLRLAQRHAIPGGYERQPVQAPGGFHARDAHGRSS